MEQDGVRTTPGIARLRRLTLYGAFLLAALGVPALLGAEAPAWTDVPSEFSFQYLLAAVFLTLFARFVMRCPAATVWACVAAAAVNFIPLMPLILFPIPDAAPVLQPLRLLQTNVEYTNKRVEGLHDLILAEDPDLISVQETNSAFAAFFETLRKQYPYQHVVSQDENADGFAVLSKLPFLHFEDIVFPNARMTQQEFAVNDEGTPITFFSLHAATPLFGVDHRDAAFKGVVSRLGPGTPEHVVLIGDFNATPWCPGMRALMKAEPAFFNARQGRGLMASWPAFFPFPFRLPIDELVVSRDILILSYALRQDIGSDHLPMVSIIAPKTRK